MPLQSIPYTAFQKITAFLALFANLLDAKLAANDFNLNKCFIKIFFNSISPFSVTLYHPFIFSKNLFRSLPEKNNWPWQSSYPQVPKKTLNSAQSVSPQTPHAGLPRTTVQGCQFWGTYPYSLLILRILSLSIFTSLIKGKLNNLRFV